MNILIFWIISSFALSLSTGQLGKYIFYCYHQPTKLQEGNEGNVFGHICLSTGGFPCDYYP